jgi:hypothetical protein
MFVDKVAFMAGNYAYEIMGAKRISSPHSGDIFQRSDESGIEETFTGFRPRIDEYISTHQGQNLSEERQESQENPSSLEESNVSGEQYNQEEQKMIDELRSRDREVRDHEQAHVAAGGAHISGGVSYTYQTGPDGKQYAIGGEVSIDTSPVKDNPEATIIKMQAVRAAAMAPANPSGADRAVAAAASQAEAQARVELSERSNAQTEANENTVQNNAAANENPIQNENRNEEINTSQETQNQIISAISAYTASVQTLSSKIDFTA